MFFFPLEEAKNLPLPYFLELWYKKDNDSTPSCLLLHRNPDTSVGIM